MSLSTGSRLGVHEILGLLGAGGMGEVYRAHDTKLNRQVAIKVLPEAYAADPERIARFHREAQAVAALNHPGIASIYDLAEADGTKFLVLELVEGETLADRLRRGPIPIEEALVIARQILEALEAAHDKGICHRDLKPANIKLTPEGTVKVLDFGLAKFLETSQSAPNLTQSPTLSVAASMPGMILGTAGYMSPEQAKGFQADHRSDIFSFGCILYELLAGRQAFDGETVSEVLAGVLRIEADLSTLPPKLNPRLVELLRRCLEKNPKKRWHAAADVRVEIESLAGRAIVVDEPLVAAAPGRRLTWKHALAAAASVVAVASASAYLAWTIKPESPRAVTRFAVPLPDGQQFTNTGRQFVAMSPDGASLVYVANQRLVLRSMSTLEARVIAGSEVPAGLLNPIFSPDGQQLAFFSRADATVKRLAISGGAAVTICKADDPFGMNWTEHGILIGQGPKGILRVSPNGGVPELVAKVEGDQIASNPHMLPDGRAMFFSVKKAGDGWDKGRVVVQSLDGGAPKTLVEGGADGRYLPTGHLVYALSGTLLAIPFDPSALVTRGGPVPLVEGVRRTVTSNSTGTAQFVFSETGSLAFVPGPAALDDTAGTDLARFDRKGNAQPLKLPPRQYRSPRVSPDGKWVAFDTEDETDAIVWVHELSGASAVRRLTFGGRNRAPIWSADGESLAYQSDREGDLAIFIQRADGSGTPERLTKPAAGTEHVPQSWSPDGAVLLFSSLTGTDHSLWTMTLKDRKSAPFGNVRSTIPVESDFSPDGRWVVYQAREPGSATSQAFVQPFPSTGAKYLVPQNGGHPFWSRKGTELIMNTGPTRSAVIAVTTAPRFGFSRPTEFPRLGRSEPNPNTSRRNVDAMPDGEHILGVLSTAAAGNALPTLLTPQITVVLNWFEEVRQRAPRQ